MIPFCFARFRLKHHIPNSGPRCVAAIDPTPRTSWRRAFLRLLRVRCCVRCSLRREVTHCGCDTCSVWTIAPIRSLGSWFPPLLASRAVQTVRSSCLRVLSLPAFPPSCIRACNLSALLSSVESIYTILHVCPVRCLYERTRWVLTAGRRRVSAGGSPAV